MSPAETKNFRATAFMLRPDQLRRVEDAQERLQAVEPNRSVSRSDVIREVLDRGLPLIEAEIDEAESSVGAA